MKLIYIPDRRLQEVSKIVSADTDVQPLLKNMIDVMNRAKGIGLAAIQIGVPSRVFVMQIGDTPIAFINPVIIYRSPDVYDDVEGCLSIPEVREPVSRSREIQVNYLDENGRTQSTMFDGLEARCIQHEIDHLDGILFIDKLSRLKRKMIYKRATKMRWDLDRAGEKGDWIDSPKMPVYV